MLPPDYVRRLDAKGLSTRYCWECVHFAPVDGWAACMRYGAYVLLYSSCGSFERRVGSDSPFVTEQAAKERFRSGLNDLRKSG